MMRQRFVRSLLGVMAVGFLVSGAGCGYIESTERSKTLSVTDPEQHYVLGAEDVLVISVWKDEHLTREAVVRPDGLVSFPLVGDIQAAGRTVEELRADLVQRLTKFIPTPQVSVTVSKVLSYRIYVLGRVNKPGEFMVGHATDILQALSMAGGLTPFAAENDIRVIRRVNGEQQVFPFRYGEAKKGKDLGKNILLRRGDVVMVP
jgi:polysaccharide export outer membrane protein